jgi:hypothetical protein
LVASAALADQFLPVLETKTGSYSNVTVTLKTSRHIHIRHDRGIANIDLHDIDHETKVALGFEAESSAVVADAGGAGGVTGEWLNALRRTRAAAAPAGEAAYEVPAGLSSGVMAMVMAVAILFHLFFAYCCRLICIKAGTEPGFMIWIPVLQIFPLLRAAGMSGWWFIGMFVPILNIVIQILWCIKIVNVRGKHVIWSILLILPVANVLAFLYLAFSEDGASREVVDFPAYSPGSV